MSNVFDKAIEDELLPQDLDGGKKQDFYVRAFGSFDASLAQVLSEIGAEVHSAESKWEPMNSAHEAYAVLLEEVDELWDHVKTNQKRRDVPAMRAEAIQVAAMALRFARDICDGNRSHK
jgi:hypothetical protein